MKIWIGRASLHNIHVFHAYLFTIARNHTFNCLKQIAREKVRQQKWLETVIAEATTEEELPQLPDPMHLIDSAIELLPPQQKKVYTLSRTHGLKQAEIAATLNISLETVKKHMVLAMRFMKNYLSAQIRLAIILYSCFH